MSTIYEQTIAFLDQVIEGEEMSPSRARWIRAFVKLQQRQIKLMEQLEKTGPGIQVLIVSKTRDEDEDLSHLGRLSWESFDEE